MQAAVPDRESDVAGPDTHSSTGDGQRRSVSAVGGHLERGLALAELILARSHGAGPPGVARLPTERQLSVDLGVTRSSVRNALALLEAQGRISREVGRGTFLLERSEDSRSARRSDV